VKVTKDQCSSIKLPLKERQKSSEKKIENIRFVLDIDGIRSVIDSTMPRKIVKQMIRDEVDELFEGNVKEFGESRFVGGSGQWHLKGRYR